MISFRFHLVSLAAIFMALALGIVLGTTVLNEATVNTLEGRIRSVRADIDAARGELDDLKTFADDVEDAAIAGRLAGVRVLIIVPEGLNGDTIGDVRTALATAGAIDAGTLTLDDKWADEPPPTDEIASALGIVGPNSIDSVTDAAAERLARDFAAGGGETFQALIEADLIRLAAGDPATTPVIPARFVVIDNGPPTGLLEPLTREVAKQIPKAVLVTDAGDEAVDESLVGLLRQDTESAEFSTVDHVHTPPGRVAAILALRDLDRGIIGDYGSDESADRAAPAAA